MNSDSKSSFKWIETFNVIIMSAAFIALFITGFLIKNEDIIMILYHCGWSICFLAFILAFSPNFMFKKHGGVAKGKSYVNTTKLVDKGIYAIIRHPQYGGGLYIAFSFILIQQTLISFILAIVAIITSYLSMVFEEKRLVVKFGEDYEKYMKRVPRVNLILGVFRKINRNSRK